MPKCRSCTRYSLAKACKAYDAAKYSTQRAQLPHDVLLNICQNLSEARDLLRLEQCSKGCRVLVHCTELWNRNLSLRFGEEAYNDQVTPASKVQILKRRFCNLARLLIPSPDFQGVLPGQYKVTWRMMKTVRAPVGAHTSDLQCSAEVHSVHPATISPEAISDHIAHKLQHFNNQPEGQWVDLPGGHITVAAVAHIHVRMWCHTGEWKRGLVWDYVKLESMNEPASEQVQSRSEPRPMSNIGQRASHAVEAAVNSVAAACRLH